ncbi:MAG: hypothetical protein ACE5I1_05275 [bacterium]
MSRKMVTKSGRRLVVYISEDLREEITGWIDSEGISMADFTRDALDAYLREKKREKRNTELKETCQLISNRLNEDKASVIV